MKFLLPLLIISFSGLAQNRCEDFVALLGERDIYSTLQDFRKECGPLEEIVSQDGMSKTWSSKEKGIEVSFINRATDASALPKFEVMMVELTAFTDEGGYKGNWPFGFSLGMDYKMVKQHIEQLRSVDFDKKDLGKTSSSFTYTGAPNTALGNRQIKVSVMHFDGKTISSMRFRLK